MRLTRSLVFFLPVLLTAGFITARKNAVGPNPDGSFTVTTQQRIKPAGTSLEFAGRPVDMALTPDGKFLCIKDDTSLRVVNTRTWKEVSQSPLAGGTSMHGIQVSRNGKQVWATGAGNTLWELALSSSGTLSQAKRIELPGPEGKSASYPCGLAESSDGQTLLVCLSRNNSLAIVDRVTGKVAKEIPVGVAPFDVALMLGGKQAWVSNWGGRRPVKGERSAPSSGTETLVDERGVGNSGTVSLVDLEAGTELTQVAVGLHASDITLSRDAKTLYVANANDDTVSILDTTSRKVRQSVVVKPDPKLPFGSIPNALALAPDQKTLYVACGGNNAVAVLALGQSTKIQGWIPAGWYPGAVAAATKQLYIANVKGNGSRRKPEKPTSKGWNVYHYAGTISRVTIPDTKTLATYTKQALTDARIPQALKAREKPKATGLPAIEHVVYIIKENRTYDQVFGDLKQGDGDPELCLFGREITPNHHALAEQFVLLDNFYCNGVLSADGHSWATEGNVTDHLEKSFGGFTRSYTFGDDPLTYSSSGFLWDNALGHGLSFVNFGEMDYTNEKPDVSFRAIYDDWKEKTGKISFSHKIGIERLKRYTVPDSIGWNMDIPDVLRADIFLRELKRYEQGNNLPNLTVLYLPNDHTTGVTPGDPTPRAYLADNDLALGQVIAGLSKSKFWPKTCVFVVEDDPQAGFDHVDGHRSLCLVVSPYTRRGTVISEFYNQTAVLHTMETLLGLPPMNQLDAMAPVMSACFTQKPNLTPYTLRPNNIPLTEVNPAKTALAKPMQRWATASQAQNFRQIDRADENTLNRILWHAMKGENAPYPAHLAGAHGKGLAQRGLTVSTTSGGGDD